MKTLIVYYSRTGTTRTVATALAERLDADLVEIRCERFRPGPIRYLTAGYHSVKGNLPDIEVPEIADGYDLALIGSPIWTSHPSLPVRSFLAQSPKLPERVGLFVTHGGHSEPETAFTEMAESLGRPAAATLTLSADEVDGPGFSDALEIFIKKAARPSTSSG